METHNGCFTALARLGPSALLREWQHELGAEFDLFRPLLAPAAEVSTLYPCTNQPPCHCLHQVREDFEGGLVAVCACGEDDCPPILLEPADAMVYALDQEPFAAALRRALDLLDPPSPILPPPSSILPLATWGPAQLPVYFIASSNPEHLLRTLLSLGAGPLILFTPTAVRHPEFQHVREQHPILHLPLSGCLALSGPGQFKLLAPIAPLLTAFSQRAKESSTLETALQQIHRSLDAVVKQKSELVQENDNLRRLSSEAYFQFAMTIEPVDFRYFAAIFTLGDRAKAARALGIKGSTFYKRLYSWRARGPEYHRMLRLVEARKKIATKKEVRLSESLQTGGVQADSENPEILQEVMERIKAAGSDARSYPALLKDVLDALLQMKDGNWDDIRAELVPMLQEETNA